MQYTQLAAFAAVVARLTSAAFTPPQGLADGVYHHYVDDAGLENIVKLGDNTAPPNSTASSAPGRLGRRAYYSFNPKLETSQCEEATLAPNDIGIAAYNLGQTCNANGNFIATNSSAQYSIQNSALVYVCNYASNPQHCSSSEINNDIGYVQQNCPVNRAGWVLHNNWAKGYGYTVLGATICNKDST